MKTVIKKDGLLCFIYFVLGIVGLGFSIYSILYDFGNVIAGILISSVSIVVIINGYRIAIRKG